MAESTNSGSSPASVDASIDQMLHRAEEGFMHCVHDCEDYIRRSPTKAVLGAAAAGYLLRHLPIRSLIVAKVRLLTALAPPALVLYGAAKVYEYLQEQQAAGGAGGNASGGGQQGQPQAL